MYNVPEKHLVRGTARPGLLVLSSLARRSVCRISLFAPLTSLPLVLCALGALSAWSGCGR